MRSTFRLAGCVIFIGLLATAARADETLAKLDLSKETAGQPPTIATIQAGQLTKQLTAVTVKGNNTLTVADKLAELKGPLLKFDKQDDVNGAPAAVLALTPLKDGRVEISWNAVVSQYQKGTRSQAIEPLLTLNLLGKDGLPIISLFFAEADTTAGGTFRLAGQNDSAGDWKFNQAYTFDLVVDLDKQMCTLKIDDKVAADSVKFQNEGPLRFVQFRDGTGLGAVDGKFTAAVNELKVVRNPADKK